MRYWLMLEEASGNRDTRRKSTRFTLYLCALALVTRADSRQATLARGEATPCQLYWLKGLSPRRGK